MKKIIEGVQSKYDMRDCFLVRHQHCPKGSQTIVGHSSPEVISRSVSTV